jgi:hypothetical protein
LDPLEKEELRFPVSAYGRLNRKFLELHRQHGGVLKPSYTWGVLHAAHLAQSLRYSAISVMEFGVAGGNGLIALERAAREVEHAFGIGIEVYGFDIGTGLPQPIDYRDMPNIFRSGSFVMDVEQLQARLQRAKLLLGPIGETLPRFLDGQAAPVGFISVDVDLYTSAVEVLRLLEAHQRWLLPRVYCYFDDILGFSCADFNGERLAIREFNAAHSQRKISRVYGLSHFVPEAHAREPWTEMMFMAHVLDHDLYARDDGSIDRARVQPVHMLRDP